MIPNLRFLAVVLAVVALLSAGCAVVTVDVDAYKGPLANTEDIQGEQVIAMAMGAKPLLVQLRDILETKGPMSAYTMPGASRSEEEWALWKFRGDPRYQPGYMPSGASHGGYVFRSQLAIRVNEILGLYEDSGDPSVAAMIGEAEALVNQYRLNREILEPTRNTEAMRKWTQLKRFADPTAANEVNGYTEFFGVQSSSGPTSEKSSKTWRSKTWPMNPTDRPCVLEYVNTEAVSNHTARYRIFRDKVRQRDADLLFGSEGTGSTQVQAARTDFLKITGDIANSYFESRDALRRLLRLGLGAVIEIHAIGLNGDGRDADLLKAVARDTANLIDWTDLVRIFSSAVGRGSQATIRPEALNFSKFLSPDELKIIDEALKDSKNDSGSYQWKQDNEQAFREVAADALSRSSGSAMWLLEEDEAWASHAAKSGKVQNLFGLGRGPGKQTDGTDDFLPATTEVLGLASSLASLGGTLDRGRQRYGIETQIERFLATVGPTADQAERLSRPQAQELLNSLVAFGQKVTQIGNLVVFMGGSSDGSDKRRYVTVLQAVGNSILVQIDELKQQAAHRRRLKDWSYNVSRNLEIHAGEEKIPWSQWDTNRFDAKDAVLQLELALRAQYVAAAKAAEAGVSITNVTQGSLVLTANTAATGTVSNAAPQAAGAVSLDLPKMQGELGVTNIVNAASSAEKIARAIEAVTELRSGMIYLRPASAYLRSSYPPTSSQRSVNMLERQSWKQVPFVGSLVDGVKEADMKTFLALDRQAWQSINRVRVAGGGRVNYVIAKDDVGNWYVKQYSTDRKAVFNAMRNVAMFSAGGAFGGQLPIRQSDGSLILRTNPVIETQFTKAKSSYLESVTEAMMAMAKAGTNVVTLFTEAAHRHKLTNSAVVDPIKVALGPSSKSLAVAGTTAMQKLDSASPPDRLALGDDQVIAMTESWLEFVSNAGSDVGKATMSNGDPISGADLELVRQTIRDVVWSEIEPQLTKLRQAVHTFQESIDVIKTGTE
jgi:hypothetical protein